ncbi:MAG: M48 family peptidase, partial [Bacteroidota bacterium]|nr:M48 family peptidase [Bacteroidota bacterium]
YKAAPLITGLKTLTKTSLSNLTPHPAVVWFQYSHPSLLQRITAMQKSN